MITGPGCSSGGRGGKATEADGEGAGEPLLTATLPLADGEGGSDRERVGDDDGPAAEPL